jgi:hypothetical protein
MIQTREIYNSNGEVIATENVYIPDEIYNASMTQARIDAYRDEADPLYFKAQRGEIEQQVWLDKIAEIKQRYPKQGE